MELQNQLATEKTLREELQREKLLLQAQLLAEKEGSLNNQKKKEDSYKKELRKIEKKLQEFSKELEKKKKEEETYIQKINDLQKQVELGGPRKLSASREIKEKKERGWEEIVETDQDQSSQNPSLPLSNSPASVSKHKPSKHSKLSIESNSRDISSNPDGALVRKEHKRLSSDREISSLYISFQSSSLYYYHHYHILFLLLSLILFSSLISRRCCCK
eukprot:TRINITY_DN4494_c0_g1_i1.p2 TRINITY_DN4494_c0_g1~~TRINITY_DN4494_c0_g1_i1.p2  ORF type:complete len:217 (+),score=56.24 TRINITY_DN4494_c0_g1_i1:1196-1846(+)